MARSPTPLPQPPFQIPMTIQNGIVAPAWNNWFQQVFQILSAVSGSTTNFSGQPPVALISGPGGGVPINAGRLYVSPSGNSTIIDSFMVQNNGLLPASFSLWFVPFGSIQSTSNRVINQQIIQPGATLPLPALQNQIIGSSGAIIGSASLSNSIFLQALGRQSP